jgi:fucose permease
VQQEYKPFERPGEDTSTAAHRVTQYKYHVVVFGMAFLCIYVGCEVAFGGLNATYAVEGLRFSGEVGAEVTSAFWGSFAVARAAAIWMSMRYSPKTILVGDLVARV